MPAAGAPARAEAVATLGGIIHERFVDDEIGRLLDQLRPLEDELDYDSDDASLIRVTRRDWEKQRRVPKEIAESWLREGAKAHAAWLEAREAADYAVFLPAFRSVYEVALRWAEHMEPGESPYDAFLDEYEPGMKTSEVTRGLRRAAPRADRDRRVRGRAGRRLVPRRRLPGRRAAAASSRTSCAASASTRTTWRLDPTVHPFAARIALGDIRMTTRYRPDNLRAIWSTLHEGGHGLSYRGLDPALDRTPLAATPSLRARRVAEQDVGEPRRPLAAVLARLPAEPAAGSSRSSRRSIWTRGTAASTASRRASSA